MTSVEKSWRRWLRDMDQDDCSFIHQSAMLLEENTQRSLSTFSAENTSTVICSTSKSTKTEEEPSQLKPASCSPRSFILSFDNNADPPPLKVESALKPKTKVLHYGKSLLFSKNEQDGKKTGSVTRSSHHAHDHTIAERKRREKISQQFIALSALIPNLKKMDKASVLGDAIKHVKQLQERVKLLEEQRKKKGVESVVYVKKSPLSGEEDVSDDTSSNSCDGNSDDSSMTKLSLPEVEARVSDKSVLIRIHCRKQNGVLANIIKEIETLRLSVTNSSALTFGSSVLLITIVAEMENEFNMNVTELARKLKVGLLQFI